MSIYWFARELWNDLKKTFPEKISELKESIFKIFIWKTTEPRSTYSYHPNPYLIFWIGFGILFYSVSQNILTMRIGIPAIMLWMIFCYLLKRYWKGKWRTYKKRMEGKPKKKINKITLNWS